mmetsp:Transcript_9647/g.19704  ORF Transcript_9647/g.19704 Transcript_9647/m.19704 type:complete len:91 (+) Transcript_9647:197-469(+)
MVREISSMAEFKQAIGENKLTLVDYFATWCGPCRFIAPHLEKMEVEMPDVQFIKVDVDKVPDVAAFAEISAMPTFIFYRAGKKSRITGGS